MGLVITDLAALIASTLLLGTHPGTQRLRIAPELAEDTLHNARDVSNLLGFAAHEGFNAATHRVALSTRQSKRGLRVKKCVRNRGFSRIDL